MSKKGKKDIFETFGFSLGFGAKPFIKAFGSEWQRRLAEAMASGATHIDHFSARGPVRLKLPKANDYMKMRALSYLQRYSEEKKNVYRFGAKYGVKYGAHPVGDRQEIFNLKVIYGHQKGYSRKSKQLLDKLAMELKRATTIEEKTRVGNVLKKEKEKHKRLQWEIALEESYKPDSDVWFTPATKEELVSPYAITKPDYDRLIDSVREFEGAQYTLEEEWLSEEAIEDLEALIDERDPMSEDESSEHISIKDTAGDRLIQYLKKAKVYRTEIYEGIAKSPVAWEYVRARMGDRFMRDVWGKRGKWWRTTTTPGRGSMESFNARSGDYGYVKRKIIKSSNE